MDYIKNKMKRRIYSEKFINSAIAKIDTMHEEVEKENPEWPDLEDYPWKEKQLIALLRHRKKKAYVEGFWMGFTLASGIDHKNNI